MRIVALGASNLTRGLQAVVSSARRRWGPDVEIHAALGHGRSYGAESRFVARTLPGILQCGLWRALEQGPEAPTRAVLTDVGNDVLYGHPPARILDWVEQCVDRLRARAEDVAVTDLPTFNIGRLSSAKFLLLRSAFVPSCRLSLGQVADTAERVSDGLCALAARRDLRLVRLRPEWYGFDPIHIRPGLWRTAWAQIVCGPDEQAAAASAGEGIADGVMTGAETLRLYLMLPERQRLFGVEQRTPQPGRRLHGGGRLKLF